MSLAKPTAEQSAAAVAALELFDDPAWMTEDERRALTVVIEGIKAHARGEDLTPSAEGMPLKMRLIRRVDISFFTPTAPRPRLVVAKEVL